MTPEGTIHTDCIIEILGGLKSDLLSLKCDVMLMRAVVYAQDKLLTDLADHVTMIDLGITGEVISDHAVEYLSAIVARLKTDAEEREKSKSNIIQVTDMPSIKGSL
jgi:hypothetical protein